MKKRARPAEETARVRAMREKFQREKPTLENGLNANPTLKTLEVIARSIGARIRLAVEEMGGVDART